MIKLEGGLRAKGMFSKKSKPISPLISVITICLNSEKHLEQTIKSVIDQTYENIEYFVIDGGSTDGTLDIIRKYEDRIAYWVSEPDEGISDAFNKGVSLSTGDYINFLNSDDYLALKDTLEKVSKKLSIESPLIAYGRVAVMSKGTDKVLYVVGSPFRYKDFKRKLTVPHQGYFISRGYMDRYGLFDKNISIVMDYDLLLRGIREVKVNFMDFIVVHIREGGLSDTYQRIIERFRVHKKNGISPKWYPYFLFVYFSIRWGVKTILERMHLKWVIPLYAKIAYRR